MVHHVKMGQQDMQTPAISLSTHTITMTWLLNTVRAWDTTSWPSRRLPRISLWRTSQKAHWEILPVGCNKNYNQNYILVEWLGFYFTNWPSWHKNESNRRYKSLGTDRRRDQPTSWSNMDSFLFYSLLLLFSILKQFFHTLALSVKLLTLTFQRSLFCLVVHV